jgi:hypothetical protein
MPLKKIANAEKCQPHSFRRRTSAQVRPKAKKYINMILSSDFSFHQNLVRQLL